MGILAAVAEFERDLLIERNNAGSIRARAAGTRIGRPQALSAKRQADVLAQLATGTSVSKLAKEHNISRQTNIRLRDKSRPDDQPNLNNLFRLSV
ncbi:Serine recombinase PinR [Pseudomonas fluorescens]|uniref:Serine recombinase PinR n=2 Tax=Pseudomonas fluorescens TaxID=294 RepID=A0A5E7Q9A7_PSEFL|nr:Serine recombinase PinR [Pseudomonas fluorescens]